MKYEKYRIYVPDYNEVIDAFRPAPDLLFAMKNAREPDFEVMIPDRGFVSKVRFRKEILNVNHNHIQVLYFLGEVEDEPAKLEYRP